MQTTLTQLDWCEKKEVTAKPLIKKEKNNESNNESPKKKKMKQTKLFKFCGQDEKLYNLKEKLSKLKLTTIRYGFNVGMVPIE